MRKFYAFSMTELLVTMMLIFILAGVMTLNPDLAAQPARREAERLAAKLESLMKKADRMHIGFYMKVSGDAISFQWMKEKAYEAENIEPDFIASTGCFYSVHDRKDLGYNTQAREGSQNIKSTVKIFVSDKEEPAHKNYYSIKIETRKESCYLIVSGDA